MKQYITILISLHFSAICFAQDENWLSYPTDSTEERDTLVSEVDSTQVSLKLDYSKEVGQVTVHEDKRIDKLEDFVRSGEETLDGVLIDGYRVLIYFDQDKTKSEQQKAHFLSLYDDQKAYVDYLAPNYRVRVGNFRTRLEAERLKQEILELFPTAIVVEDKIQLPTLPGNEDSEEDSEIDIEEKKE